MSSKPGFKNDSDKEPDQRVDPGLDKATRMVKSAGFAWIKIAGVLGIVVLLGACGAQRPFQRGPLKPGDPTTSSNTGSKPGSGPGNSGQPPPPEDPQRPLEPPRSEEIVLDRLYFESEILPLLEARRIDANTSGCNSCHRNPAPRFEDALQWVVVGKPQESPLYQKAVGATGSRHRAIWQGDSPQALKLIYWINGGPLSFY